MGVTDVLDLAAIAFFVAAGFLFGGPGAALVVAAVCCLALSWSLTRAKRAGR